MTSCLIAQRLGIRCQSCKRRYSTRTPKPSSWLVTRREKYRARVNEGKCARCQAKATRGVLCDRCHAYADKSRQKYRVKTPKRPYPHNVNCHLCDEPGHMQKTCPVAR